MTKLSKKIATAWCFALCIVFTGGVHAQSALKNHDTYQPIDITAESLEMKQKEGRAVFKGAVKVVQGKMTFASDTLTVFYVTPEGAEKPTISRLDALSNVTLVSTTESLSGDWGIYDVDRRLVTIGGNVVFQQGDSVLKGSRLEFDLVSGLAKLDGEARGGDDSGRVSGTFSIPKTDDSEKPSEGSADPS